MGMFIVNGFSINIKEWDKETVKDIKMVPKPGLLAKETLPVSYLSP